MNLLIIVVLGIFVGFFLNDWSDYYIDKEAGIKKRNRYECSECHHPLKSFDMIPILSFIMYRGKCRYCKSKISFRYPFFELLNGVLYVIMFTIFKDSMQTVIFSIFISVMLTLAYIDIKIQSIPYSGLLIILLLGILSFFTTSDLILYDRACAMFIISIPLLLLSLAKKESIGGADIMYMMVSGFLLGLWGIIFTACIAYLMAGIYSMFKLILQGVKKDHRIAMFPFFFSANLLFILFAINWVQISMN